MKCQKKKESNNNIIYTSLNFEDLLNENKIGNNDSSKNSGVAASKSINDLNLSLPNDTNNRQIFCKCRFRCANNCPCKIASLLCTKQCHDKDRQCLRNAK